MKLSNNVALTGFLVRIRNLIIDCYVDRLAAGNALLCRSTDLALFLNTLAQRLTSHAPRK